LKEKNVAFMKDEGSNFNVMSSALKFVINCEIFASHESLQGTCFGHTFSKACQYGTLNEKMC
jgi:hypothetical protein